MPVIRLQKTVNASAKNIYKALTEQKYLEKWFATEVIAMPKQDTYAAFAFGFSLNFKVYITKLIPDKTIIWEFVTGNVDWENSSIIFELEMQNNNTKISFKQKGLQADAEKLEKWKNSWCEYLNKLKDFTETNFS